MKTRRITEWRKIVIGTVGLCLIVGSVYGLNFYIDKKQASQSTVKTIKPVRLLKSGEVIDEKMLHFANIPEAAHNNNSIVDPRVLLGKTVIVPIGEEEEIAGWKLADKKLVPTENERFYSFKTDAIANVNNMVRKGDRVDVWIEFDTPRQIKYAGGNLNLSAMKIIEGLQVASVRTGDGIEVMDASILDGVMLEDYVQLNNARGKATGKAEANTYIMTDEIYGAYVAGMTSGGRIKLALPNVSNKTVDEAKITDLFSQLNVSDALKAGTIEVKGNVKSSDVSTAPAGAQPTPVAKEVK